MLASHLPNSKFNLNVNTQGQLADWLAGELVDMTGMGYLCVNQAK